MALLSVIRRWHFRDRVSVREIAKRLGISRNTVRRYLRSDDVVPVYPKRVSPSKLDGFAAKLSDWLKREASRSRKQRKTVKQLHADLVALGFTGSYDRRTRGPFTGLPDEDRTLSGTPRPGRL